VVTLGNKYLYSNICLFERNEKKKKGQIKISEKKNTIKKENEQIKY
jgi:hypothetical protein